MHISETLWCSFKYNIHCNSAKYVWVRVSVHVTDLWIVHRLMSLWCAQEPSAYRNTGFIPSTEYAVICFSKPSSIIFWSCDVSCHNSTVSTWTFATPRTTSESIVWILFLVIYASCWDRLRCSAFISCVPEVFFKIKLNILWILWS